MSDELILEVNNLQKYFTQRGGIIDIIRRREPDQIQAVDNIDLSVSRKDSIAVIGESGCGKTTLLFTLMGLYDPTGGEIKYNGKNITHFSKKEWKNYRSNVQVIFQDPFNSLDPKLTVRETLKEPLIIHDYDDKETRIQEILSKVELNPPENYIDRFPRNLSGGEKQRVSIARALILEPDVVLADEPVSMLDVSTQAAVLDMMKRLIEDLGVAMIYISHDLSTVSYISEVVNVMYLGRIVETATTKEIVDDPKHPYSQALISAVPIPDPHHDRERTQLAGTPPDPINLGEGCRFRQRCPERMEICEKTPEFLSVDESDSASVACHLYYDHEEYMKELESETASSGIETAEATQN